MKTNWTKKIISGVAIGCLFLSLGALAAAHDSQGDPMPRPGMARQADMPNPADAGQHIKNSLGKLVNEGTITKDQADKVMGFFKEKDRQRKAEMEKMRDMSPEDRKAYMEEHHKDRPDFIGELKTAAGLSEEQAKAVADAIRPPLGPKKMEQHIQNSLGKLVNEGTITKEQADKVISFFKEKESQRKAEMEKTRDMSPEDRKAYMEEHRKDRPDFIGELRTAAGLSEEQVKAVADAIRPPHGPRNPEGPAGPMMPRP